MHVGFYHEAAGTRQAGGVAVYVRNIAAALADTHEVTLYTRGQPDRCRDAGVHVVELPAVDTTLPERAALGPVGPQAIEKLCTAVASARAGHFARMSETLDVAVTMQVWDDLVVSRALECPTAYQYHRMDTPGAATRLRELVSGSEVVLANGPHTASRIEGVFGYRPDGVVPPGVDTDRFHPSVPSSLERTPSIAFAGRLVPQKGIDDLLVALSLLDREVHCYLAGRGDTAAVTERARRLGVGDSVTVVGELDHSDLPGVFSGATVACLPSHTESFGLANLEAMACGTPVVTTALPAIRSYVSDGVTGRLVPPGSPRALARALSSTLDDPGRMGERARAVATDYDWKRQGRRFGTVLERSVPAG